jgi:hypothetical protein
VGCQREAIRLYKASGTQRSVQFSEDMESDSHRRDCAELQNELIEWLFASLFKSASIQFIAKILAGVGSISMLDLAVPPSCSTCYRKL